MKLDFSMAKAGDKNVGPLEIQRPDGEYDVWDIVKRGRLYLIGSFTNSGLLSDYYFVRESGESEMKAIEEINADLEVLAQDGESYMSRVKRIPKKGLKKNPPFYAHNLYEKKTHGLNLKQMRRLYAMVSRGNRKAITYARNVLGIPFSESPTQVKAVVYHHVRDLAERRVRRNPGVPGMFTPTGGVLEIKQTGYYDSDFEGKAQLLKKGEIVNIVATTHQKRGGKIYNYWVVKTSDGKRAFIPVEFGSMISWARVRRNPFGGETLRSFKKKYKGFEIIVEIQPNTILATWTNGDILESDRFSGYELDEIFEEVKARIDALKRRRR